MSYKGNPIHEAADKVAELTGIPSLGRKAKRYPHHPRRQIVLPAIAVTGSITAFVTSLLGVQSMTALAPICFVMAILAQYFGPIRPRDQDKPYDECEQLLIWRSRSIGLGVALGLAVTGLAGFNALTLFEVLKDVEVNVPLYQVVLVAVAAMWLLITTATGLTTIAASLMLPKANGNNEG